MKKNTSNKILKTLFSMGAIASIGAVAIVPVIATEISKTSSTEGPSIAAVALTIDSVTMASTIVTVTYTEAPDAGESYGVITDDGTTTTPPAGAIAALYYTDGVTKTYLVDGVTFNTLHAVGGVVVADIQTVTIDTNLTGNVFDTTNGTLDLSLEIGYSTGNNETISIGNIPQNNVDSLTTTSSVVKNGTSIELTFDLNQNAIPTLGWVVDNIEILNDDGTGTDLVVGGFDELNITLDPGDSIPTGDIVATIDSSLLTWDVANNVYVNYTYKVNESTGTVSQISDHTNQTPDTSITLGSAVDPTVTNETLNSDHSALTFTLNLNNGDEKVRDIDTTGPIVMYAYNQSTSLMEILNIQPTTSTTPVDGGDYDDTYAFTLDLTNIGVNFFSTEGTLEDLTIAVGYENDDTASTTYEHSVVIGSIPKDAAPTSIVAPTLVNGTDPADVEISFTLSSDSATTEGWVMGATPIEIQLLDGSFIANATITNGPATGDQIPTSLITATIPKTNFPDADLDNGIQVVANYDVSSTNDNSLVDSVEVVSDALTFGAQPPLPTTTTTPIVKSDLSTYDDATTITRHSLEIDWSQIVTPGTWEFNGADAISVEVLDSFTDVVPSVTIENNNPPTGLISSATPTTIYINAVLTTSATYTVITTVSIYSSIYVSTITTTSTYTVANGNPNQFTSPPVTGSTTDPAQATIMFDNSHIQNHDDWLLNNNDVVPGAISVTYSENGGTYNTLDLYGTTPPTDGTIHGLYDQEVDGTVLDTLTTQSIVVNGLSTGSSYQFIISIEAEHTSAIDGDTGTPATTTFDLTTNVHTTDITSPTDLSVTQGATEASMDLAWTSDATQEGNTVWYFAVQDSLTTNNAWKIYSSDSSEVTMGADTSSATIIDSGFIVQGKEYRVSVAINQDSTDSTNPPVYYENVQWVNWDVTKNVGIFTDLTITNYSEGFSTPTVIPSPMVFRFLEASDSTLRYSFTYNNGSMGFDPLITTTANGVTVDPADLIIIFNETSGTGTIQITGLSSSTDYVMEFTYDYLIEDPVVITLDSQSTLIGFANLEVYTTYEADGTFTLVIEGDASTIDNSSIHHPTPGTAGINLILAEGSVLYPLDLDDSISNTSDNLIGTHIFDLNGYSPTTISLNVLAMDSEGTALGLDNLTIVDETDEDLGIPTSYLLNSQDADAVIARPVTSVSPSEGVTEGEIIVNWDIIYPQGITLSELGFTFEISTTDPSTGNPNWVDVTSQSSVKIDMLSASITGLDGDLYNGGVWVQISIDYLNLDETVEYIYSEEFAIPKQADVPPSSSGLSTGALIGIIAGSAAGALLLGVGVGYLASKQKHAPSKEEK